MSRNSTCLQVMSRRFLLSCKRCPYVHSSCANLRIHNDFAEHLALLKVFVRGTDFAKRKCAIDHRFQPSRENMSEDFVQLTHGPHVRPEDTQLPRAEMSQVDPD